MVHPELSVSDRDNQKLVFVAHLVKSLVPEYDIRQSDPLIAAHKGIGNCVAKAAISAVLLGHAQLVGAKPALAWNTHTHPKHGDDLLGRPRILNGHAYLLATNTLKPYTISAISYNPGSIINSDWEIFDFNSDGDYAKVDDGNSIIATEAGQVVGYVIEDWHEGGRRYLEAIGETNSIYHQQGYEELSHNIIASLVEKDLLSRFSETVRTDRF